MAWCFIKLKTTCAFTIASAPYQSC
jgi:hypothetical protein